MTLLIFIVVAALATSFLCSVLEAAVLSTRLVELAERKQRGDASAALLLRLKTERLDDVISSILIFNTIANTIGAALAGAQAAVVFGDKWVGAFSGVLTFMVLLFSEIIPKTLGTTYASPLVPFVARTTRGFIWLLRPVLKVTGTLTRMLSSGKKQAVSRGEVAALVTMATEHGTLHENQSKLVSNILQFETITVGDIMTPRMVMEMLPAATTIEEFLALEGDQPYSRIPLFEETRDQVVGYILSREVFLYAARSAAQAGTSSRPADLKRRLDSFLRAVWTIPETETVGRALRKLIQRRDHVAIVGDEFGGLAGLVTLEDILETVLGAEILDESDEHADLRVVALELRNKRLRRPPIEPQPQ